MRLEVRNFLLLAISIVGLSLMSGCATTGPAFTKVENIPEGKGLIYIYRQPAFKGAAISYDVHVKDKVVTNLTNGGYFPYMAEPGETEVWAKTEAKSSITVDVKPGQTYYVKGGTRMGFMIGRPELILQPNDVGAAEIMECKLIAPPDQAQK